MSVFLAWLTATLAGAAAFLGFVAVVTIALEIRRLRAAAFPLPGLIVWQRIRSVFPATAPSVDDFTRLHGRRAWLYCDLRWVTGGETLAEITGSDAATRSLHLRLMKPIELMATAGAPAVRIEAVDFLPRNPRRVPYGRAAVSGTLRPVLPDGMTATAQIVVYPTAAHSGEHGHTGRREGQGDGHVQRGG